MNKTIGIIIGAIAIIGIAFVALSGDKNETTEIANNTSQEQNTPSETIENTTEQRSALPEEATTTGSYVAYSTEKIAMAATGDVVLFFHASWCPSCRALNEDIEKNLNTIPSGLTILKTDYDKETELKQKYGVTTQHTLVQVDKDGNLIKKWSGGSKLENLVSQVQ